MHTLTPLRGLIPGICTYFKGFQKAYYYLGQDHEEGKTRREKKIAEAAAKLAKVNEELHTGSLNIHPLPFEKTVKVIKAAQKELAADEQDPHRCAWKRLFRNITPEEQQFATRIEEGEEQQVKEISRALIQGEWNHPIFSAPRFGQYTVQAFKQKQITIEQLATVFLRWEAAEQFLESGNGLLEHPIFENETLSAETKKFLLPALWKLSPDENKRFFDELAQCPLSEQSFWTVKIPKKDYKEGPNRKKFGEVLEKFQSVFHLFRLKDCFEEPDRTVFVIPSFSILKTYLRAVFMQQAVAIIPEFGIGAPKQIELDIPQNKRLFALHFPGVKGLDKGDGYYFGKYLSSFHDFYHCHQISLIPLAHRLAYLRLSHLFKHCLTLSKKYPDQPLLTVYWTEQKGNWGESKLVGKVHKFNPIHLKERKSYLKHHYYRVIDLEQPASDGYLELFEERISFDWNKKISYPSLAEKRPFTPFKYYHHSLNGRTPESYFNVCASLFDMVGKAQKWKNYFGIDAINSRPWHECEFRAIQAHLIEGFQNKKISTPPEEFTGLI